jgi:amino acid transporter
MGQVIALQYLRKHRPDIARPFRMWLYPVPSIIAFLGWVYIFLTSGWWFIAFGAITIGAGAIAYVIWRAVTRSMP